jgi:HK97 family phage portal protein
MRLLEFFARKKPADQRPVIANASPENPSTNLGSPASWLVDFFHGGPTQAGRFVNSETAMRTSAVYACVTLIAQTIASLPLKVYRRVDGDAVEVPDHPAYYLLHDEPNPAMTSTVWREFLVANLLLGGNAYAAIGRTKGGTLLDLFPIPYSYVHPRRVNGRNLYKVDLPGGGSELLDQSDMLHIPGLSFDGLTGLSVISHAAREAVGLALATEEHGGRVFSNGASLKTVLKHPKNISKPAQDRLRTQFEEQHAGLSNAAKTLLLEEGMDVSVVSMTMEDAQYLETRRFQVEDIARFFRVPPHLIGHTDKQTSWGSGIEQMLLGFLTFTLVPWLVRFEQEFNRKLFPRSPFYAQFKTQGLLRGDSQARAAYYASGHQHGWLSINEIRAAEDMNRIPGGDRYFINANLVPLERAGEAFQSRGVAPTTADTVSASEGENP